MIIFAERDGNDVTLYYGNEMPDHPSWHRVPFDRHAVPPDDKYVTSRCTMTFDPSYQVFTPADWNMNIDSPFSIADIIRLDLPIVVVVPKAKLVKKISRDDLYSQAPYARIRTGEDTTYGHLYNEALECATFVFKLGSKPEFIDEEAKCRTQFS